MTQILIQETSHSVIIEGEDTAIAVSVPSIGVVTAGIQGPSSGGGGGGFDLEDGAYGDIVVSSGGAVWTVANGLDAAKIGAGTVSNTEFGYLDGVTSSLQSQIDGKLASGANAATASALQTARTINGTSFNGTANITVTAAAGTLTGTTLNASVTGSSLTGVGTITSGIWQGTAIADAYIASASGWNAKPAISSGAGTPSSTPAKIGDIYIDTSAKDAYTAVGTASSGDWEKHNDGSGSGSPGGSNTQLQFNSSGAFAGAAALTYAASGTHLAVTAQSASDKPLVVKGAASQTGNLAEFQSSAGTAFFTVGPDTLSGASSTSNFLNLTATTPTTLSSTCIGVNVQLTTAGSSSAAIIGHNMSLLAGYTGSLTTTGLSVVNSVAGTGATYAAASASNSYRLNTFNGAIQYTANATTSGINCGMRSMAHLSSTANYAAWNTATSSGNSAALNVGVASFALNATTNCAGLFALADYGTSAPTFANCALIADNGSTTGDIFIARDNGTSVFKIADGGVLTASAAQVNKIRTVTSAGAVTVSATTDYIIEINKSSGAATTVNLPSSPATGLTFIIKDGKFDAATNNITLTPASGNIDNAASYIMNRNGQSATIAYNGTQWIIL